MPRHYGMDWLRIGAFGLLIFYHIGMFFVHTGWGWHVKTEQPLDWVAIPMLATSPWRLVLLFVVSGYASGALLGSFGSARRFAADRTARLMLPVLFAAIFIIPPQPWVELLTQHSYTRSFGAFWLHDYFRFGTLDGIVLPTWQHLWFVVYLWIYILAFALLAALLPGSTRAALAKLFDRLLGGWLVLAVPIGLLLANVALAWPGVAAKHDFVSDAPYHRIYFGAFLFGALLGNAPQIWAGIRRSWTAAAALAVAAYGFVVWVEVIWPGQSVPPSWVYGAVAIAKAFQAWGAIVALLGVADRWLIRDHPWRATLAEAVYPFYIVHQTIIVIVGWYLLRFGLGAAAEFAIILPVTVAGCWTFYLVGRRVGWLRRWIGLKPAAKALAKG